MWLLVCDLHFEASCLKAEHCTVAFCALVSTMPFGSQVYAVMKDSGFLREKLWEWLTSLLMSGSHPLSNIQLVIELCQEAGSFAEGSRSILVNPGSQPI